jgi:phage terminase large subunit-like protein
MGRAVASGPAFSRKRADHVVRFIENLTLSTDGVASQAGDAFVLRPWQKAIVREVFGRMRLHDPTKRAYRTAFIGLPRKNGKSELCAALALYGLIGDGVSGAQVYSAAADQKQAALVFEAAQRMVEKDPELSARIKILAANKRMVDRETNSIYQALSAEAYSKHGLNASMVIYDELHAAPNRELWDVLRTSMGARKEPLMITITTAGFDKQSICWELWEYARKVRDGELVDPAFYQVLYETPEGADWTDERVWHQSNPALGDFRDIDEMRAYARESAGKPEQQNTFRRLYLNQWTEQETRWLDMHRWAACRTLDPSIAAGRPTYAGLDLGLKSDLVAFVAVTPFDDLMLVRAHFWMPKGAMEVYRARPYETWRKSGALTITDGDVTDFERLEVDIARLWKEWGCTEGLYDQTFAEHLRQRLTARLWAYRKADDVPFRPQAQGYALNIGLRAIEEAVVAGTLAHNNNPVLTWMAGNAVVDTGQKGDIQLKKMKAREKVDGIAALSMAMQLASIRQAPTGHAYDKREVLIL